MPLVSYEFDGKVAVITMDDGKVNVLSPAMQGELNAALDRAEADGAAVLLTGRTGVFSAGFDLKILQARDDRMDAMVRGGFELSYRLLSFPAPVVIACPGHAIAMGSFLLLSGDYLIGAAGEYRLTANEVAIGLKVPQVAIEVMRNRLTPAYLARVVALAEPCPPADAVAAGYLDRLVPADELLSAARTVAEALAGLDRTAHATSKERVRRPALAAIRAGLVDLSTVDS